MDKNAIELFLQELKKNEKELANINEQTKSGESADIMELYAESAKRMGYDLTVDEIRDYMKELDLKRKSRTRETARGIMIIDDEAMVNVAGGYTEKKDTCEYSFEDEENCFHTDGCDNTYMDYNGYHCKWANAGACPLGYINGCGSFV